MSTPAPAEALSREQLEALVRRYFVLGHSKKLIDLFSATLARAEAAEGRIRELEKVLGWYADSESYDDDGALWIGDPEADHTWERNCGKTARAALEGVQP